MRIRTRWIFLVAIASIPRPAAPLALAQTAEERGRRLAEEADRRARGYRDLAARVAIISRSRHGDERTRAVRVSSLTGKDGSEKTIILFDEPRDVRGTALLTAGRPDGKDEQWLYLPAVGQVKRIASHTRSGSFMGTEFSYEDIVTQEVERYRYRYVGEDTLDGVPVHVLERFPLDAKSQYRRQVVRFDREAYRALRIDYYDRADALLKTLHLRTYRLYAGRFWRPDEMEMVNHRTQASTRLRWGDYRFGTGLAERDFDPPALSRAR